MGFMSRTTGFILSAGLATLVLVCCAASTSAQDPDPGETIMLKSCQGCHDIRVIQTTAHDAQGWTQLIAAEIKRGAVVSKEDMPVLVKYLTLHHGPVPDGPGREILLNTCTMCHDLGRIKTGRRTPEEWEETLISMLNEGAPLSDAQFPAIHRYLSRNFGVE